MIVVTMMQKKNKKKSTLLFVACFYSIGSWDVILFDALINQSFKIDYS